MSIVIKPLSPPLIGDYLYFFDHIIFSENPDWSKCYCYSYHFTGTSEQWQRDSNREAVQRLIKANEMKGYMAFDNDQPVGWCNANDRKNYQALTEPYDPGQSVCSIVCFLVSPDYRRKGIARRMLERVCSDYAGQGYGFIEAYPAKDGRSCETNYHGHFRLYEEFGFKVVEEHDDRFVVRKELQSGE